MAEPPDRCWTPPGTGTPIPGSAPTPTAEQARTHRGGGRGEGQAEQHQQRDELLVGFHVGHGECPVMALEAHLGRLEEVCQLQEIERHDGGGHDGQLWGRQWAPTRPWSDGTAQPCQNRAQTPTCRARAQDRTPCTAPSPCPPTPHAPPRSRSRAGVSCCPWGRGLSPWGGSWSWAGTGVPPGCASTLWGHECHHMAGGWAAPVTPGHPSSP